MKDEINVNDDVDIHFGTSESLFNYRVSQKPQNTGDTWVLKSNYTDTIVEVQQFAYMIKLGDSNE